MSHYDALGVPRGADGATIKRAYRRKSRQHHPDRPGGNHQAMVAINKAFETLSDPEKRARYDQFGDEHRGPSPDQIARNIVMQIFLQLLEKTTDYDDLIKLTREQIRESQKQIPGIVEQTKQKILKLKRSRKRLKYRGGNKEPNFIDDLLGQQIAVLEEQIGKADERIKSGDRAIELLQDFEYEVESAKANDQFDVGTFIFTFGR